MKIRTSPESDDLQADFLTYVLVVLVAQTVERWIRILEVVGSMPIAYIFVSNESMSFLRENKMVSGVCEAREAHVGVRGCH